MSSVRRLQPDSPTRCHDSCLDFPQLSIFLLCNLRDGAFSLKMSLKQNFSLSGRAAERAAQMLMGAGGVALGAVPWSLLIRLWAL